METRKEKFSPYEVVTKRAEVTDKLIETFKEKNIVKFIFFDEKHDKISSDNTIHEIHKFKSKYRGNTYIRLPLKFVEEGKYVSSIAECSEGEAYDGFVVVSKRDLSEQFKHLRYAKKDEKIKFGETLCRQILETYNCILDGKLFHIKIKNETDNTIVYNGICFGTPNIPQIINNLKN